MSKDIAKPSKNKGIAKDQALWLLNLDNGRIFPWTTLLAVRKGFVDCTAEGKPINPDDVPGDHPWIKQQTQGLRDRMAAEGGRVGLSEGTVDHMLQDFGRQLTDDAAAKFKSLDYERAVAMQLEHKGSAETVGAAVRAENKLDKRVRQVKEELYEMAMEAIMSLGFRDYESTLIIRRAGSEL